MHTGKKISLLREAQDLTQEELATMAGLESRGKLAMWETERVKNIPLDGAAKVAAALHITLDDLVYTDINKLITRGETNNNNLSEGPEIRGMVPLISWVAAGKWTGPQDIDSSVETWLPCPKKNNGNMFALRVDGDSMEPKFFSGDIVFVDPDASPDYGRIVVAVRATAGATMKQLVNVDGKPWLKALNPDYTPKMRYYELAEGDYIVGVVVGKWVDC